MLTRELLPVPLTPGGRLDINSGVARLSGKIWATLWKDDRRPAGTAVLIVHPSSNFLGHYALEELASRGVAAVGLATRYAGNDSALIMENCVLDVGAAIRHLRELGYDRIVLVGNSGGGGLAALYQAQAENPAITHTPAGDPADLAAAGLIPADRLVMAMAHPGRAVVYTEGLDPAITDEHLPFDRDPELDMFEPANGPVYSPEFVTRYRQAQIDRNRRITGWALQQIEALRAHTRGSEAPDDLPFVVHGTAADLRFLDLTLDPSDRIARTIWGSPWVANFLPASLGHLTSLRSWLSQWSYDRSRANAYRELPGVQAPVMVVYGSADCAAFPSHARGMYDAVGHQRRELVEIKGADHYFQGRPDLAATMCDHIVEWAG
ncbi:alpha/beta hydrolase [Acrocarpospora pleiomorpha]|uniref:Alpha/beta hydrolase n=1 Tax=Acrocarpospora pleiomorpha TaxID=90975 RepID=A0A5M3XII6_9ACTN|nr:alpha/beta hydrolase [Acrocarpospora pleiomorpha]GES21307.1 alpha/beta hydrolase [Acrocarpospora pleiomorpha]